MCIHYIIDTYINNAFSETRLNFNSNHNTNPKLKQPKLAANFQKLGSFKSIFLQSFLSFNLSNKNIESKKPSKTPGSHLNRILH